MKIAIISDIHGNYPALMSVLEKIDRLNCDVIYSLGDVCGYYCMINECIEELRKREIKNILGNHDYYLVQNVSCLRSAVVNTCIEYQRRIITEDNYTYIKNSVETVYITNGEISLVHGGWNDFLDEYMYDVKSDYFINMRGSLFFSGHTHIQQLKVFDHVTYCNPGSVGQPRDGDRRASFCVIDGKEISRYRVEYDIDHIASKMRGCHFSEYYYSNLYNGRKIGSV